MPSAVQTCITKTGRRQKPRMVPHVLRHATGIDHRSRGHNPRRPLSRQRGLRRACRTARLPASKSTSNHLRPRLNLAQAKSQRDRPAHAVPPIHGRLQRQLYLIDRERLDLVVNQPRCLCQRPPDSDTNSRAVPRRTASFIAVLIVWWASWAVAGDFSSRSIRISGRSKFSGCS